MKTAISDRLISMLFYYTFGMFGLIWLIWANVTKNRITRFVNFNIYQSIFLSVIFAVISYIYSIMYDLIVKVPFVGNLLYKFNLFFFETPLFFTFTFSGLIITLFLLYIFAMLLMGKIPFLPIISNIVKTNFGE